MTLWTMKVEVAPSPDLAASTARSEALVVGRSGDLNTWHNLGLTDPSPGDGSYLWKEFAWVITPWFVADDTHIAIRNAAGPATAYYRRFRVEGDDGSIFYGGWPQGQAYSAAYQDGGGGEPYMGFDEPPGGIVRQYNVAAGAFEDSTTNLDFYFAPAAVTPTGFLVGTIA